MTPVTEPQEEVQLLMSTGTAPGPDGHPWVVLAMQYGLTAVQVLLPEPLAERAGPMLAQKLAEGAAAARRARLGIILPTDPAAAVSGHLGGLPGPKSG